MNGEDVSVVIPAFNREATVLAAVRSVLGGTIQPLEVIVVDDGSTDRTAEVVEGLGDSRVQLVRQANGGISAARNAGIATARGSWVAFQDSDDEWLPHKLELQLAALAAMPTAVAAYSGLLIVGRPEDGGSAARGRQSVVYHPDASVQLVSGRMLQTLLATNPISTQTLLARRGVLNEIGCFDTSLKSLVDWDIAIRLAVRGEIAFVDEPMVLQHFTPNSITRDRAKRVQSWIKLLEKHRALFEAYPDALLKHYLRIAGNSREMGEHARAAQYYRLAARLEPLRLKTHVQAMMNALKITG